MRLATIIALILSIIMSAAASEISPPPVPEAGERLMPEADSFGEGLIQILEDIIPLVRPDLHEASKVCIGLLGTVLLASLIQSTSEQIRATINIAVAAGISSAMLLNVKSLIHLAGDTITEMTEYGKLLLPVMTTALAAQGGIGSSAALYAGTAAVNSFISSLISKLLLPAVYIFIAVGIAMAATGEEMLKKFKELIKTLITWFLKTVLSVFTAYMGITGVISGTTDAAALKVTKATISSVVPVVGGILSDASEAVLVSVGIAKNAVGIYGIFAVLALFLEPFLLIGSHYLMLKITTAICGVFGTKSATELVCDFSTAMGLLLAMTGSVCLLQLISAVCFLKGVS